MDAVKTKLLLLGKCVRKCHFLTIERTPGLEGTKCKQKIRTYGRFEAVFRHPGKNFYVENIGNCTSDRSTPFWDCSFNRSSDNVYIPPGRNAIWRLGCRWTENRRRDKVGSPHGRAIFAVCILLGPGPGQDHMGGRVWSVIRGYRRPGDSGACHQEEDTRSSNGSPQTTHRPSLSPVADSGHFTNSIACPGDSLFRALRV